MSEHVTQGARARRGAGNESKRKRAREEGCQRLESHAAKPPRSGRQPGSTVAADNSRPVAHQDGAVKPTAADNAKSIASSMVSALRIVNGTKDGRMFSEGVDFNVFIRELESSATKLRAGDLSHVEDMLLHQAIALQAVFTRLTADALACREIPSMDLLMRYGLRAQNQCRSTLETLAAVKNPPVVFARQANVTTGPQQVNNGLFAPSRARDEQLEPNELSGEASELRQDTGATAVARPTDTPMAPVGTIDRTTNIRGQAPVVAQRVEGRHTPIIAAARKGTARPGEGT